MRLIGYARVSTDEQAASGYGLSAQRTAVRESVAHRGDELVDLVAEEGASGGSLERPVLHEALRRIAAGEADGLIVSKLDRASRSVVDFGMLLDWFDRAGATFVALDLAVDTSTPGGRLVANVLVAVAEWERGMIAQRTAAGLAAARAEGKQIGPPAVRDQPELVERIHTMRDSGMSLREIAAALNADGVPTPRGGTQWRASSLQTILGYKRRRRVRGQVELPPVG